MGKKYSVRKGEIEINDYPITLEAAEILAEIYEADIYEIVEMKEEN